MKHRAAHGQHSLLEIVLRHFLAVTLICQIVVQARSFIFVHFKLEPEALCKRLLCKIIAGRAESAGGDNYIRSAFRRLDAVGKALGIIAHNGVVLYIYAYLREHERNVTRVGIRGVT